ncbi:MAG: hypothetical protein EA427_11010 [Spirochaetaceae bacterium]|nr:MAG: hypothetical protein EA427_11010 [Spirochaetaceae bacterium]
MGRIAPHQHIMNLVRALPAVDVQNRLLRVRDTDLALAMLYMVEDERNTIIALAGPAKGGRVREALARLEHTRIRYDQYEQTAGIVIRMLQNTVPGSSLEAGKERRSYYRPTWRATGRNPPSSR